MKRNSPFIAVTAFGLMALLMTSGAGTSVAAVACVCPDGQVEIEAAAICSCCHAESVDDRTVEPAWGTENASCDDCVDVPLRVPPLKNDHVRLQIVAADSGNPVAPVSRFTKSGWGRSSPPEQGHRLTLALLSSVVLLT